MKNKRSLALRMFDKKIGCFGRRKGLSTNKSLLLQYYKCLVLNDLAQKIILLYLIRLVHPIYILPIKLTVDDGSAADHACRRLLLLARRPPFNQTDAKRCLDGSHICCEFLCFFFTFFLVWYTHLEVHQLTEGAIVLLIICTVCNDIVKGYKVADIHISLN